MNRMRVILNPAARGYSPAIELQLYRLLSEERIDFELVKTSCPGQAKELAKDAANNGFDVIVAGGGNGTCCEVISGLLNVRDKGKMCTFGIIPIGLGNELAKAIGIPLSLPEACHSLACGQIKLLDIGQIILPDGNARFFANTAGIGFNARIAVDLEKTRWLWGFPMFVWMTIKSVAVYNRAPIMTIEFDGQEISQPFLMVVVANGQREGTVFQVAPQAKMDDGFFDLLLVSKLSRLQILKYIPRFIKGDHITDSSKAEKNPIALFRTKKVTVSSEENLVAHIDGDVLCTNAHQLKFDILPQRLRVLY